LASFSSMPSSARISRSRARTSARPGPGARQRLPGCLRVGRRPAHQLRHGHVRTELIAAACRDTGCDAFVETPARGQAGDWSFLRKQQGR
jgi:hypothetical protein